MDVVLDDFASLSRFPERFLFFESTFIPDGRYRKMLSAKRYLLLYEIDGNDVYVDYIVDFRQDYEWLLWIAISSIFLCNEVINLRQVCVLNILECFGFITLCFNAMGRTHLLLFYYDMLPQTCVPRFISNTAATRAKIGFNFFGSERAGNIILGHS